MNTSTLLMAICLAITMLIAGSQAKSVFYPGIGKFDSHDFYDAKYRPFTDLFVPVSPEQADVEFLLYTRENWHDVDKLSWNDTEQIKNSHFDPKKPTKFYTHGYIDSVKFGPYMEEMKDEYLEIEDINFIVVDWSRANGPIYGQAVVNTRVVGAMIAIQIQQFIKIKGGSLDDFHLLGHSLGSHVSANAGKFLKGQLGRITGLDPAGPYFEHLPAEARLWHTDAKFVDAIHTDARLNYDNLGLGMEETCGHIDFYPNSGSDQPGCTEDRLGFILNNIFLGIRTMVACSHQRAVDFYMDSLAHKNEIPKAFACSSYNDYVAGKCMDCKDDGSGCAILGPRALEYYKENLSHLGHGQKFYLGTAEHKPYLGYQYLLRIKMASSGGNHHDDRGSITIKFNDKNGNTIDTEFGGTQVYHLGETYSHIYVTQTDPDDITSLVFHWSHGLNIIHTKMFVESIELDALTSHHTDGKSKPEVLKFCNDDVTKNGAENGKDFMNSSTLLMAICLAITMLIAGSQAKSVYYPTGGVGFEPVSPEDADVEFLLYTRENWHDVDKIDWNDIDQIKESHYDPTKPTKFYTHGFIDSIKFGPYMEKMKDQHLELDDINFIIVDWSRANGPIYGQAVANTRTVGEMIATLIQQFIQYKGGNLTNFHLLGHSLGAHVSGFAGKALKGELGRITGFDPAGPAFQGEDPEDRLWHTDAKFVDAIHTDAIGDMGNLGLGMEETCGHIDFFPNDGRDQPGCTEDRLNILFKDLFSAIRTLVTCSHQRSVDFYMDALAHKHEVPKAFACDNYDDFP
ncbi:Lipase [Blomia tropicalis]|nr:Lipase [Blomia tropicalis]